MHNSNAVQQFLVFAVAHGVVQRFPEAKIEIEHRNIRLLLLQPGADTLSVEAPETFIELVWSRCIHTARAFWTVEKDVERFKADCSIFELSGNQLSDAVKARAVSLFQWQGTHKPSSKAVGVSLVRDKADGNDQTYIEVRTEERMSGWANGYVYLPSEVSAQGQSGTGLTDKKNRLVSVVSGNYTIGTKKCAVAVLVEQHVQLFRLLEQGARAESFVPAAQELWTQLTSASSETGKKGRPEEGDSEEPRQVKRSK